MPTPSNSKTAISNGLPTREAYSAIERLYNFFNEKLFGNHLPVCLFTFQRQPKVMGYFSRKRWVNSLNNAYVDEIAINPEYFYGSSIEELCQTVVHEMCHVWQHHFGSPSRTGYHNREWAEKMISLGLMPSNTGLPGGAVVGQKMDDFIVAGGRLYLAIQELSTLEIVVNWVDTIPVSRHLRPVKIYDESGRKVNNQSIHIIGRISDVEQPTRSEMEAPNEGIGENSVIHNTHSSPSLGGQTPDLLPARESITCIALRPLPEAAKKPQTRVKYRCECDNQVWGKPRLNLRCEDCGGQFFDTV